jgi:hypothetical protein
LKEYVTAGWKEQKETGKVPEKVPAWYKYQIEIYNILMNNLVKLESFATEKISEEPLYAGLAVGIGGALFVLFLYLLTIGVISFMFGKTPEKPKRD